MMKKVVIIGGGFAGSFAARALEKDFMTTLIDTKDDFVYIPGTLRSLVQPSYNIEEKHQYYLPNTSFIKGHVKKIDPTHVLLNSGKKVLFDYLILATGSTYDTTLKKEGLVETVKLQDMERIRKLIEKGENILLIGGGLVGVELAAEIITKYPDKNVKIVHSKSRLLHRTPQKVSQYAKKFLQKKGVKVLCNERIEKREKGYFLTSKQNKIAADIAFLCTGVQPNSGMIKESLPKEVDKKGYVKVKETLQLAGYPNIFAAGDVVAIEEEKLAQNATLHATLIAKNIKRLEEGKPLMPYLSAARKMVVSLGKYDGIYFDKSSMTTGLKAAFFKSMASKVFTKKGLRFLAT
ncbi:MAG: FAD-dependent oxidoreductase [Bacteroidota bacterium]